ncbi:hypothetical protein MRB53_037657 [Persea americana]|nr:hypothetical protein MRB53_037657 [Persea americana]
MADDQHTIATPPMTPFDRQTLCISQPEPGLVVQRGDTHFTRQVENLYHAAESGALEELVALKADLRTVSDDDFWYMISSRLSRIAGAQFMFISKRILADEEGGAVEMPPLGEPGSCLMALSWYFNDGCENKALARNISYHAFQCPCAHMRHDKVFIIPEKLNEFIPENPNQLPFPGEAYLGVPLFSDGKCFAHFGLMWSPGGAAKRELGWGFLELLCHAVEDIVLQHVLSGAGFRSKGASQAAPAVIPHAAVSFAQSLKPFARNLSHELRTPMQGVVGMLDVMYATVQDNLGLSSSSAERQVQLKACGGGSRQRRASIRPQHGQPDPSDTDSCDDAATAITPVGTPARGTKRKSSFQGGRPSKKKASDHRSDVLASAVRESDQLTEGHWNPTALEDAMRSSRSSPTPSLLPNAHMTNTRQLIEYVVHESLRVGKRPDSVEVIGVEHGPTDQRGDTVSEW